MRQWQERANELSADAYRVGEPTAWFDRLYSEGADGSTSMPWDRGGPHPALAQWAADTGLRGDGRRAVVVGCGLGADAEFVAGLGFTTTGFDLAPAAIAEARRRHPDGPVEYAVANVLELPLEWLGAFDLVVEIFTLQAMPDPPRSAMAVGVRSLVATGGTLFVVQFRTDAPDGSTDGPPFALSERFMTGLATDGLELGTLERLDGPLWRAAYRG